MQKIAQIGTIGLWIFAAYAFFIGLDGTVGEYCYWIGPGLIAAHIIEIGVFWPKISANNNLGKDVFLTLIYGYFHANFLDTKAS